MENIIWTVDRIGFNPEEKENILRMARSLPEGAWNAMKAGVEAYRADMKFPYMDYIHAAQNFCETQAQRDGVGLAFALMLGPLMLDYYRKENRSETLFDNAIRDLKWKYKECMDVCGYPGWFSPSWFTGWFDLSRIALERLQFEPGPFEHTAFSDELTLTPDSPVIYIHIPSSGPLDRQACLRDYAAAAAFFGRNCELGTVFACHSWLLNPDHPKFLSPKSRLLPFQADFTYVDFEDDPKGSFLWRLFGKRYDGNPDHLTSRNSLEAAYKKRVTEGGRIGAAVGYFLYRW